MTIIKAREAKTRTNGLRIPVPVPDDPTIALRVEIGKLQDRLGDVERRLAEETALSQELRAGAQAAREEGRVAGHEQGYAKALGDRSEALKCLEAGLSEAHDSFRQNLADTERLALILAVEAVGRLVDEPAARADLLRETITRHVAALEPHTVVRLTVSSEDFPDPTEVLELAGRFSSPKVAVEASPREPAGSCRLQLLLGELDIGLDGQWMRLREALVAMIAEGRAQ